MKLLSLKVENFQGLKAAEFDFGGKSASIYGTNGIGKTTLFSAFTWLLFGKDSTGSKNFTPKSTTPKGEYVHHTDHVAEARLQCADGRIVTLRKVYRETYGKQSGSAEEKLTGHTTDHFIDDRAVKEKDYQEALNALCHSAERMMLLTMPDYFSETYSEDERRKLLLDTCGDVSDDEVISLTPALKELPQFLLMPGTTGQYYDIEEYRQVATAQKKKITDEKDKIPIQIKEAQRAIPDVQGLNRISVSRKISELTDQKVQLEKERLRIEATDASQATRTQIVELEVRLAELRAAHIKSANNANEQTQAAIAKLKSEQREVKTRMQDDIHSLGLLEQRIERFANVRAALLADYAATQAEAWDESKEICPTCQQSLPEEQVQALRESFNVRKSERLVALAEKGKKEAGKEILAGLEGQRDLLNEGITKDAALITDYDRQIAALQEQVREAEPFESTLWYINITKELDIARKGERLTNNAASLQRLSESIQRIQDDILEQQGVLSKFDTVDTQNRRIEELKTREKELAKQQEYLEKGLHLCDLFTRAKVALLTDPINAKFQNVRFRLFIEQVNGGIKKACDVMIPSPQGNLAPFPIANRGGRINAGLEIIDTLSKHWGQAMPLFVDNAESVVVDLYPVETQVIRLVASKHDGKMRMEANQ